IKTTTGSHVSGRYVFVVETAGRLPWRLGRQRRATIPSPRVSKESCQCQVREVGREPRRDRFHAAHVSDERRRAEAEPCATGGELETKVAEGTSELGRLADERAALRRVATLVGEGATSDELFPAVVDAVAGVLEVSAVTIARFESDDTSIIVASHNDP